MLNFPLATVSKAAPLSDAEEFPQHVSYAVAYPASNPDHPVGDAHSDWMRPEELAKTAWRALGKKISVGEMHRPGSDGAGEIIESFISPVAFSMEGPHGREKVGPGDWVVGIRWSDKVWPKVRDGIYRGLSIQGLCRKVSDGSWGLTTERKQEIVKMGLGVFASVLQLGNIFEPQR